VSWSYNAERRTTGDSHGIIPRVRLEESAEVLYAAGIRNRPLIVDVLKALSGLSRAEVKFNVDLALQERERTC
jgi:hypothetical protein